MITLLPIVKDLLSMCIKHACTCHKMYTGTTEWTEKCQNQPGRECQVHITQKYDDLFQSG